MTTLAILSLLGALLAVASTRVEAPPALARRVVFSRVVMASAVTASWMHLLIISVLVPRFFEMFNDFGMCLPVPTELVFEEWVLIRDHTTEAFLLFGIAAALVSHLVLRRWGHRLRDTVLIPLSVYILTVVVGPLFALYLPIRVLSSHIGP